MQASLATELAIEVLARLAQAWDPLAGHLPATPRKLVRVTDQHYSQVFLFLDMSSDSITLASSISILLC